MPSAARSLSRMAINARPYLLRMILTANQVMKTRQMKIKKKNALSPAIFQPRMLAVRQCDAHGAFGQAFPLNQDVFDDELTRQCCDGQIKSFESAGRNAEDHTDHGGNETGGGDREIKRHTQTCRQNRRGIRADAEKRTMPQGDLSGIANENIEADGGNGQNADGV